MVNVIQTVSIMVGTTNECKEIDFKSRVFNYDSFERLIEDFEGSETIIVEGEKPFLLRQTDAECECLLKTESCVMYRLINPTVFTHAIVRMYIN